MIWRPNVTAKLTNVRRSKLESIVAYLVSEYVLAYLILALILAIFAPLLVLDAVLSKRRTAARERDNKTLTPSVQPMSE